MRLSSCVVWLGGLAWSLAGCSSALGPGDTGTSVTYTTVWTKSVDSDLDVVYVVDTSAASAAIQSKVAAQIPMLTSAVQQQCTGVDGVLPNLRTAVVSSSTGQLFQAVGAQLPGFLRPEAHLHLIFISDGDDSSAGAVSDFVAQIRAVKADPDNQISVSAIIGASAPRIVEFTSGFANSVLEPVDDEAFTVALTPVCDYLPVLRRPPCVPADATDCVVTERLTAADGVHDLAIPGCADVPAGATCWSFHDGNPGCFDGDRPVVVDDQPTGSDPARYSVQVVISCQLPAPAP